MLSGHRAVAEACGLEIIATGGSVLQLGGKRLLHPPSGDPYTAERLVSPFHKEPGLCRVAGRER